MRNYPRYLTAEFKDILISVAVLTAGFFILIAGKAPGGYLGPLAPLILGISFLTVLSAFLLHELAHRFFARRYGGIAFFKMWIPGVLLALLTAFIGILFAAPGAVNIGGIFRKDQVGKTALAGPATNLAIGGGLFLIYSIMGPAYQAGLAGAVIYEISGINLWFALFNLIPIPPFDGEKIFAWSYMVYIPLALFTLALNFLSGFIL